MSVVSDLLDWLGLPSEDPEVDGCSCDMLGMGGPCAYHVDLWRDD